MIEDLVKGESAQPLVGSPHLAAIPKPSFGRWVVSLHGSTDRYMACPSPTASSSSDEATSSRPRHNSQLIND